MKFGHIKNIITSRYDKFRIIDSILNGDINIRDIGILTLEGKVGREAYRYIVSTFHRSFDEVSYVGVNKDIKLTKKNIGYWSSGRLDYVRLTIKNCEILLEELIK